MAYCKKCGVLLDDDAAFCPSCGTPVATTKKGTTKAEKETTPIASGGTMLNANKAYGAVDLQRLPEGYMIDERYKILRKLGQGSFGAVYLAYDEELNTNKALKIIPEAISNDRLAMESLKKEASIMIKLNHKNIVRVHDFHHRGDIKYIDMEYVDGKGLEQLLIESPGRKLPEDKVREYALQIAEGLRYAHNKKVIHKDIKPQNILLTKEGEIKLMDFGIAETVHSSMSRLKNTGSSGTLVYMSPEQLEGKDVGKEADIYSLGATLYELLTGNPPFYRGDITYQIINKEPELMAGISKTMSAIVLKCLEKDLKKRFGNCDEFAMTLKNQNKISNKIEKTIQHRYKNEASDKLSTSTNIENKSPEISKKKGNLGRFLLGFLILVMITLSVLYYLNIKSSGTKQPGKHPGFSKTKTGLYYKFYHRSKDTTKPKLAEYALVKMVYGTPDSVLFDSRTLPATQRPMRIPIIKSIYKGDIYEGLEMMHVGDSAVFQSNADSVFIKLFRMRKLPKFVDSTKDIYFAIKLVGVQSLRQMQAAKSARMMKLPNEEAKEREAYLKKNNITVKPTQDGLYFIPKKSGKGPHPQKGDKVSVHYTGYLLNGKKFDSSVDRGKPFEFTLGMHQVIPGWDEGIAMLRKGGTAKLIIPSSLGYGTRNMGPIPPFSTLVFDVKLVSFHKAAKPKK